MSTTRPMPTEQHRVPNIHFDISRKLLGVRGRLRK
jgi:hypothetical protein